MAARDVKSVVKSKNPVTGRTGRFLLQRHSANGYATRPPDEDQTKAKPEARKGSGTILPPHPQVEEAEEIRKPGESDIQAIKRHRRNEVEKLSSFDSPLEEAKYIMDRIAALDFKKARLLEMCSESAFEIVKRYI